MVSLLVLVAVGAVGLVVVPGVMLILSAILWRKPPPPLPDVQVPIAQVIHGGHSPIDEPRPKGRKRRALGRITLAGIGSALVAFGVMLSAAFYSVYKGGLGLEFDSKGRLLRLRGRAHLPEVAHGEGWHDDAVPRVAHLSAAERATLADAWHLAARMEHASVPAFAQLGMQLAALGAPSELVERTHLAALDEIRHTRRCFAMARAYGGEAWTAGPIAALVRAEARDVDLVRLAVGSLIDGCVAEGIAADVAANGARGAEDPVVRAALAMIAADEATHAELAWSVLDWCLAVGGEPVRAAVAERAARLDAELAPRAPDFAGIAAATLAAHGLFDQGTVGAIAARRIRAVRARASALTAPACASSDAQAWRIQRASSRSDGRLPYSRMPTR